MVTSMSGAGAPTAAVGATARWTAAARARETTRPDRLFDDPWAAELAGPDGTELLAARERGSGPNAYLPVRTRFLDDVVVEHRDRAQQVVLLGAGHDTRALRLPLPSGTTVFALDHGDVLVRTAEVVQRVRRVDAARTTGARWVPVAADLRADWADALLASEFDPDRSSLWLAEGLFYYLEDEEVRRLLATAADLSRTQAVVAADVFGTGLLDLPGMRDLLEVRRRTGVAAPFCTDDPRGLLRSTGWVPERVVEPGQDGAQLGRLPRLPQDWGGGSTPRLRSYFVVGSRSPV